MGRAKVLAKVFPSSFKYFSLDTITITADGSIPNKSEPLFAFPLRTLFRAKLRDKGTRMLGYKSNALLRRNQH